MTVSWLVVTPVDGAKVALLNIAHIVAIEPVEEGGEGRGCVIYLTSPEGALRGKFQARVRESLDAIVRALDIDARPR